MSGPQNLTRKLLGEHLESGILVPGEEIDLSVDQVLIEDATGSMTALQFEELGIERVAVPLAVMYVDHNVLQIDDKNMNEHRYLQTFSACRGILYSRPGNGISHYVHLERFARPGELLVGADSHSTMAGAVGMFALGAGGLDVAVAMAGYGFSLECPKVVGVELRGELPGWVQSKDVILELLRRYGVRGGLGRVFEFTGDGVATLSVTERGTICNMITELGATAAVFPGDDRVREWLAAQQREEDYVSLAADPGAPYDEAEVVELPELEPLIAKPSSPGNVAPVREVVGTGTVQVCVGSSVNSSYEDLATVAAVLRESVVHPTIEMTVTPGSRQILDTISRSGVYQDFVAAGARMLEPVCGPCIGVGQAPSAGAPSLRTFNRNFPGRSGTSGDEVYLCSPATAAATALKGQISDPRELGDPPEVAPAPSDPAMDDRQILKPPPEDEAKNVQVVKGPNIVSPPEGTPLPETLEGRVVVVVEDDVSTGDMAPDGALGMSLWSNIPECAKYMFRRQDPEFHDRALEWGGGFIVGGHNYGQGSSREHAALAPLHLGIRAVIAKSFARIHRRNLISQGILPLLFADEEDYSRESQGDEWRIEGVREAVATGKSELSASNEGGEIGLEVRLSPRERRILLAGGVLKYLRGGGEAATGDVEGDSTSAESGDPESGNRSKDAQKGNRMVVKEGWQGRFFEDFEVGDVYEHPLGRTVTTTDNIWFTLLTQNTAPIHFDHHLSAQTEFGKPLVDSTFTVALVTGQSVTDVSQNVFANLGWDEVRLPAPVFEGDTIYSQSEVLEKRESKSRENVGIVTVKTSGYNQDGTVVITFKRTVLVYRREHAPDMLRPHLNDTEGEKS